MNNGSIYFDCFSKTMEKWANIIFFLYLGINLYYNIMAYENMSGG